MLLEFVEKDWHMPNRVTRRDLFAKTGLAGISLLIGTAAAIARPSAIVSKASAVYRLGGSPRQRCSTCRLFLPAQPGRSSQCHVVEGPIDPDGGCVLWEQATAAKTGGDGR